MTRAVVSLVALLLLAVLARADEPIALDAPDLPDISKSGDEAKKNMAAFHEKYDGKVIKATGKLVLVSPPEKTKDKHYHYVLVIAGTEKKSSTGRRTPQVNVATLKPLDTSKALTITGKLTIDGGAIWIEGAEAP
jgi:hypothetical protein